MTSEPMLLNERAREPGERSLRSYAGMLIASMFSGLFWTGISALVAAALGYTLSLLVVALIAAAITLFLFAVGSALVLAVSPIDASRGDSVGDARQAAEGPRRPLPPLALSVPANLRRVLVSRSPSG
jgi:hypothetical protein